VHLCRLLCGEETYFNSDGSLLVIIKSEIKRIQVKISWKMIFFIVSMIKKKRSASQANNIYFKKLEKLNNVNWFLFLLKLISCSQKKNNSMGFEQKPLTPAEEI
jgi:hypothetical protein